jgi:hypothetical protein
LRYRFISSPGWLAYVEPGLWPFGATTEASGLESRAAPAPEVFTAIARETGIRFIVDEELRPVRIAGV